MCKIVNFLDLNFSAKNTIIYIKYCHRYLLLTAFGANEVTTNLQVGCEYRILFSILSIYVHPFCL